MQLFLKRLKGDPVLLAAWGLALVSAFLVPPDREWLGYVDFHTLGLLFCLMLVMAGLQDIGFFQRLGEGILGRTRTARQLELVLVLLCFFTAMLITNDVALITFVPFAGAVLGMAGLTDRIVPVVVFQTVAANLGSMGNTGGQPPEPLPLLPLRRAAGRVLRGDTALCGAFAGAAHRGAADAPLGTPARDPLHRRTAPACPGTAAVLSGTVPAQPCGSRQADPGAAAGAHGDGSYSAH